MSTVNMDTTKLKLAGEDLQKIAKDYSAIIDELYTKIANLNNDGVWTSDIQDGRVFQFISKTAKDKPSAKNLANDMNTLGVKIVDYATSMKKIADDVINE